MTSVTPHSVKLKVRARAVDMLGRQQIAGIPTAIHELFKNAYDAFAQTAQVDLIRSHSTLILRDDGFGMTREEFESKWLTVGTESKLGTRQITAEWLGERGKTPRLVLGEKGIGRLAIASIGPAVLILTRAVRESGLSDTVVSLIHWTMFEIPALDLDEIQIPILTLPGGVLPTKEQIETMVGQIKGNLDDLSSKVPDPVRTRILGDLRRLQISPEQILNQYEGPSLLGDGHGTHFFVRPYDPILNSIIDDVSDDSASTLEKMLLGFSNTMLPNTPPPPLTIVFRDHTGDGEPNDIVGDKSFFSPEEFKEADHNIDGSFDEYGQFSGMVRIYNKSPLNYSLSWNAKGALTECGPFAINFGYVQGLAHESLLPPDEWTRLAAKLNRVGGLYIYRDGIRILPYGDSDYDFLNIERRRTKAAKDWIFSYRRIYGVVTLSSETNKFLQEKAGREGFRENTAYRQFKAMLENLFMQLAKDFFRESAQYSDDFRIILDELQERDKLLKKSEQLSKNKKQVFRDALDTYFDAIEDGTFVEIAADIKADIAARAEQIFLLEDAEQIGSLTLKLEEASRQRITLLRERMKVRKPQGIGLTKALSSDWNAYRKKTKDLDETLLADLEGAMSSAIGTILSKNESTVQKRKVVQQSIKERSGVWIRKASSEEQQTRDSIQKTFAALNEEIREHGRRLRTGIDNVLADFERTEIASIPASEIGALQQHLIGRLDNVSQPELDFLAQVKDQLDDLLKGLEVGVFPDDVKAALEEVNDSLKNELQDYLEWAQVGMALGIVQHEFDSVVKGVKKDIQRLKPWADGTPDLRDLFKNLRAGFNHLETYLGMFAPLERRLHRQKADLTGNEIVSYLRSIFGDRFSRHQIDLHAEEEFLKGVYTAYPSTLYPALINLVDNACYWLSTVDKGDRRIVLKRTLQGIELSNNGPGIPSRIADRIFEFGFSQRPSGRGMGLYIVRKSLQRDSMNIELLNAGSESHPAFLIHFQ